MRMTVLYHMFLESGLDIAPKDELLIGSHPQVGTQYILAHSHCSFPKPAWP